MYEVVQEELYPILNNSTHCIGILFMVKRFNFMQSKVVLTYKVNSTVEHRSTDTRLIRTPRYYGQFSLPRRKASSYISLKKNNPLIKNTTFNMQHYQRLQNLNQFLYKLRYSCTLQSHTRTFSTCSLNRMPKVLQ